MANINATIRKSRVEQHLGLNYTFIDGFVTITSLDGAAAECPQLKVGDVIISINNTPIFSLANAALAMRIANNPMQLQLVVLVCSIRTGLPAQSGGSVR
ncbi:unnamed protein product [Sphagnum balticum]